MELQKLEVPKRSYPYNERKITPPRGGYIIGSKTINLKLD